MTQILLLTETKQAPSDPSPLGLQVNQADLCRPVNENQTQNNELKNKNFKIESFYNVDLYLSATQTLQPHVSFVPFNPVHAVIAIVTLIYIRAAVCKSEVCPCITCVYALLYPQSMDSWLSQLPLQVKRTGFHMLPH